MPCIRPACCRTRGTSEKLSADKNGDKLGSQYSSSSELSNPTVVNINCCISPENHPPRFWVVGPTVVFAFHVSTLCTLTHCIYFACCGTLGASEESSAHITGSFVIAALVFRLQKTTCGFIAKACSNTAQVKHRVSPCQLDGPYPQNSELLEPTIVYTHCQDLFETNSASESIASAHDKLSGPLPPKFGVVGTKYCIKFVSPKVVYTQLLYLAWKYTELLYLARSHPLSELCENMFDLGESLGLSNRHDGQGSRDTMPNSGSGSSWDN